jgi:hypothetical protein
MNKPATRKWQNSIKLPQKKTEVAKSVLTSMNRFSALEIEEMEEEPEEEEGECPPSTKILTPFTHETKEAEDFLQQNYKYQQAVGITSPIVKTALALKFVRGNELGKWRADLKQWIDALNIDTDDVPLVWDLFAKELKERARHNKDDTIQQQLANLRMDEGQLKKYINEFEKLAEQIGLTPANPTTTQTFVAGLTTRLQERVTLQPIYGYRIARARAIQEDQEQHAIAKALRARQQQRRQLIDLLRKRHELAQEDELPTRIPVVPEEHPVTIDHPDQLENERTTTTSDEIPVNKQHAVTEALRMKQLRKERLIAMPQEEHRSVQKEETRSTPPIKRPVAADYFNHPEDESATTNLEEPLTKKQRIASMKVHSPSNADHIRSSNTDVYISIRKSMTVQVYVHSKSKRTKAIALLDSGATENFIELKYTEWLQLPIKRLPQPRQLFNVDGTENRMGKLQFYTDLKVQTGTQYTVMWFFLTELGTNKMILGYPWFAAVQPNIDWK